jgi:hypothetical protein
MKVAAETIRIDRQGLITSRLASLETMATTTVAHDKFQNPMVGRVAARSDALSMGGRSAQTASSPNCDAG